MCDDNQERSHSYSICFKHMRRLEGAQFQSFRALASAIPVTQSNLAVIENEGVNSGRLQIASRGDSHFKLLPKPK